MGTLAERLASLRAEMQRRLARPKKRSRPTPEPRYDEVFFQGLPRECRDTIEAIAISNPPMLGRWILSGTLQDVNLSHAAEMLGQACEYNSVRATSILLELLEHPSAIVREGAIYGLSYRLTPQVRERLEEVRNEDSSPGVREAIKESLDVSC